MTFHPRAVQAGLLLVPLLLALAGCGLNEDKQANDATTGQVLPGTISDAMLPLDTVRSQAPLAPPPGRASATDATSSDAADAQGEPADEAPATGAAAEGAGNAAPSPAPAASAAAKPAAE